MPRGVVKSAGRVLALLEYLREARTAVSVTEIAHALDMPQSSASMLLRSLEQLGYLAFSAETRRFRATYRVGVLGDWVQESMIDSGPLTQAMDALGRDTGETIILGQQNGATVQYIHIVPASYPVQLRLKAGLRRPMTCAATGLALLGLKADKEVRAVVRRNNADVAEPRLRVREASFLETIALVRAQGYAETRGNMTPGAAVIAVAITAFGHDMAIGVGGPIERIDASRPSILRLLRQHLGTALRGAKA